MQKYGMEWFWRLATNPRRLALRYARCAIVLAEIAIVDPLKARVFGRSS
jgi:UDP-N-acetyl-D-mannosaminuronic acid transferase (WecB/TagA/CpsF family)